MSLAQLAPRRRGLWVYLDGHDVARMPRTIETLRRCGAVGALPLIEGVNGHQLSVDLVAHACEQLATADISAMPFSFPHVGGELQRSIDHAYAVRDATRRPMQWDIEPAPIPGVSGGVVHWSQTSIDKLLAADPTATITSTRAELPRWDARGREIWLQLESQESTETLDKVLAKWPDAILVTGVFDQPGDPRLLVEVGRDLGRCTPQAKRTGTHAVWSAHTMTPAKADMLRDWALATF